MMTGSGIRVRGLVVRTAIALALVTAAGGCDFIKGLTGSQQQKVQEAYLAYFHAIQSEDIAALKTLVAREKARELESPDAASMLGMVKAL